VIGQVLKGVPLLSCTYYYCYLPHLAYLVIGQVLKGVPLLSCTYHINYCYLPHLAYLVTGQVLKRCSSSLSCTYYYCYLPYLAYLVTGQVFKGVPTEVRLLELQTFHKLDGWMPFTKHTIGPSLRLIPSYVTPGYAGIRK